MPRKEDIIINYRPELAKTMENDMETMIAMYKSNLIATLYDFLSKMHAKEGENEKANLLKQASICVSKNDFSSYEEFEEKYRGPLNKIAYGLGDISNAQAAGIVFETYEEVANQLKSKALSSVSNLTKSEKYMVERFYKILSSPTRNPNIKVQEGKSKCYYDENKRGASFVKDLKSSIEFVSRECENIYRVFNTPDFESCKENEEIDIDSNQQDPPYLY